MNFVKRMYELPQPDEVDTIIVTIEYGANKITEKIVDADFRNALAAANKIGMDLAK